MSGGSREQWPENVQIKRKKKLTLRWLFARVRAHTETTNTRHMRTKTLFLTAAFSAAGMATSMAQTVYSVNIVGYINLPIVHGLSLVANQLNASPNNSVVS